MVLDAAAFHTIPFTVDGQGDVPGGIPLFDNGTAVHTASGNATRLGSYEGAGEFRLLGFTSATTGTFESSLPFVFEGFNRVNGGGDQVAFDYGNVAEGAGSAGQFRILPQADGNIVIEFVAEFTLDVDQSTGRFDKYSAGQFTMIATTEPFAPPSPGDQFTMPFGYSWEGQGTLSFPVGSTFEVTTLADTGEGSLRGAIGAANAAAGIDTITFAPHLRGQIPLESELTITDDVTILGPGRGVTLSGQEQTRVLSVNPFAPGGDGERVAVEIRDLTIADGLALDAPGIPLPVFAFGGGLYNLGSDVSLEDVVFRGNQAGNGQVPLAAGGAIANEFGGTVTVNDGRFIGNSAVGLAVSAGGAITSDVGPTADGLGTKSPVTLVNGSLFTRNTARALQTDPLAAGDFAPFAGFAFGGAVNALAGEFQSVGNQFHRNSVSSGDGVNGNTAGNANGGAVFVSDFSPFIDPLVAPVPGRDSLNRIVDSQFRHNSAKAGDGDGSREGGNAHGGAVVVNLSFFPETLEVSGSSFYHNQAVGGRGGANDGPGGLGAGGALASIGGGSVSIAESDFAGNNARGGSGSGSGMGGVGLGGALGFTTATTSVPTPFEALLPSFVVDSSRFYFNTAQGGNGGRTGAGGDGRGGAIGVQIAAASAISDATFFGNRAQGARGGWRTPAGNGLGGGIYNDQAVLALTSSTTAFNRALAGGGWRRGGGGTGLGGGLYNSANGTFTIDSASADATFFNWASDRNAKNFFGAFDPPA